MTENDYEQDRLRSMLARNPDLIVNSDLIQLLCPHSEKYYFPRWQTISERTPIYSSADCPSKTPSIPCQVKCRRCGKQLPDENR